MMSLPGDPRNQAQAYRDTPACPQEQLDWANALENVIGRMLVLEGNQRSYAATMAVHTDRITNLDERISAISQKANGGFDKLSSE